MANSLSPGYVILHYTCQFGTELRPHKMTIPIEPGGAATPGIEPSVVNNSDDPVPLSTAVDNFLVGVLDVYSNQTQFTHAEYWSKPTPTSDPLYIYTYAMTGKIGTGGANISAGQATMSFRTNAGGIAKVTFMESNIPTTLVDQAPFASLDHQDIADFLVGDDGWHRGRDGGLLITSLKLVGKLNDVLRRRYILGI